MNLSSPFINRPIATTLLAIGLAIAGIVAFNLLPVASLPQIEFPTISVQAALPGASPETMATSVATPLERTLGRIAGITEMTSSSGLGNTTITVQFDLSRNIDGAARDVQAAINAARGLLPTNLPNNPTYRKVNPAEAPIMIIALTSDTYTSGQMYDFASTILQQKLSQIKGIGQVIVGGASLPAVRVELNPTVLNKYGISLETVRNAIASTNVNRPKGQLNNAASSSEIITNDQLYRAVQYKPLIITYRDGRPVRLSDVGDVIESVEDIRNAGLADGKPGIPLVIFKEPNANVIETVNRVRNLLPHMQSFIPAAINMTVMMDRTSTIRASLHDVERTLIIAIILVILVVYFSLGKVRAALIPAVAVPLSLLGTFTLMYLCGFSLNNLSLMALTISTGFVVDDAVVVLENTMRHIEAGIKPIQAALLGAKEVGFTVVSMSLSLVAVFIPILLMSGIVGRLFHEFAITLSLAILVSLLVSLTVTPMMCARLLKPTEKPVAADNEFAMPEVKSLPKTWLTKFWLAYENGLRFALNRRRLMLLITVATIVANVVLFAIVPKGFFPQQDTGRIMASIQGKQDSSFQAMKRTLTDFVNVVKNDSAVEHVVGFVGGSNNTGATGRMFITLKPLDVRKVSADTVINRLRSKLAKVPGANLYLQAAQDLVIGGRQGGAQFQYTLSADNLAELNRWAGRMLTAMNKLPGIADINTDQRNNGLQTFVTYDYDTAARFGITAQTINNTLYDAFGQRQISIIYTPMNQYHVVMEVAQSFLQQPETLREIYVAGSAGQMVPLSAFAQFAPASMLLAVNHQSQFPAATFSFNLLPGVALGDAVNAIERASVAMHLPASVQGHFAGTAQAFQAALANEPLLILAALVAVYIVLGILYESTIHPITILSTLPSAGAGAILALLITHTELSIISLIGIILLIGIVKKNAIMMIDFALDIERSQHVAPQDAIYQAAILRFRPIMMTTFAALLGALPLVIDQGVGSELRRPLGIAIVGGLIVSQMLTLFTTPVIYLQFERWFGKKK